MFSDLPLVISIAALLVSLLSALYSRWVWSEQKKANDIAVHNRKLEIYKSFESLRFALLQHGTSVPLEEVAKFYPYSRDAEFYFSPDVHQKLEEYGEICFKLAILNRERNRGEYSREGMDRCSAERSDLLDFEIKLSEELNKALRKALNLNNVSKGVVSPRR